MTDSVNLTKGETVNLTKKAPSLAKVFAAAGWDVKSDGPSMDLDLALFGLKSDSKVRGKEDFVYFGNLGNSYAKHTGDNLTGAGDGDDEVIDIDLSQVPAEITTLALVASIYNAKSKNQNLRSLDNAFVRIVNKDGNVELAKHEIRGGDGYSFALGKLTKDADGWSFTATGEGVSKELGDLANEYGLNASTAARAA